MPSNQIFINRKNRKVDPFSAVGRMLSRFDRQVESSNYSVVGFDFGSEATNISSFENRLSLILKGLERNASVDSFGNIFNTGEKGSEIYDVVELRVDPSYKNFVSIRLHSTEKNKNYVFSNVKNDTFSATTLRIASDIETLSASESTRGGENGVLNASKCKDTNSMDRVKNLPIIPEFQDFLESRGEYEEWSSFIETYAYPKPKIISKGSVPLTQRDLKGSSKLLGEKTVKTDEELAKEEKLLAAGRLKIDLNEVREKGFDFNDSSSVIFSESRGLNNKLNTLEDFYTEIMDRISLGCLVKTALECVLPPVDCKEILRGIRVENLRDRIDLALPNLPKVADKIKGELDNLENPNDIDAALDIVEKFIDLEAICDVGIVLDIPTFDFELDLPIVDLFAGLGDLFDSAIIDALIRALKEFIRGLLDDLLACNNLDTFIIGAMEGNISASPDIINDLNAVFNSTDLPTSLQDRWETFEKQVSEAVAKEKGGGDIPFILGANIGESEDFSQEDDSFFEAEVRSRIGLEVVDVVDKLSRGEEVKVEDTLVISSMLEAGIDVTKMVNLQGTGAQKFKEFLGEIGKFQLSDDGKSLTLNRISDDQIVNIFKARSIAERVDANLLVTGQTLVDQIGKMLNDVVAILSPTETLNLFVGDANEETLNLVSGLVRIKYKDLDFLTKPQKVRTLFKNFGQLTGLNSLRDKVRLLETAPCVKQVPRKFCPEDDARIKIRENILRNRDVPEEDIDKSIKNITDGLTKRYNDLIDAASKINKGDIMSPSIMDNIACGLQPDGSMNPLVDNMVDRVISLIYEPVRMAFDREVVNYPKSLSIQKNKTKNISRTVQTDGFDLQIFNPLAFVDDEQPILKSLGIDLPSNEVLNPELQRLISNGFVPTNDNDEPIKAGDNGRYDGAKSSYEIPDTSVEVGKYYKDSITLDSGSIVIDGGSFAISGKLPAQNNAAEAISLYSHEESDKIDQSAYGKSPSWDIKYIEEGGNYTLNIEAAGSLKSPFYGTVPFSENFLYQTSVSDELELQSKSRLQELSARTDKADIFVDWFTKNVNGVKLQGENVSGLEQFLYNNHEKMMKSFFTLVGQSVSDNRLLDKIPSKNSKNDDTDSQMIVLNLIDFSPEPTKKQKECGLDPHLLDPESIKKKIREQFDSSCGVNEKASGYEAVRQPLNSSGLSGVVLTTIRLYCIDYILRSLFVLDNFEYAEDIFFQNDMFVDYIRFRIIEDMKRRDNKYYNEFMNEIEEAHDQMYRESTATGRKEKFKYIVKDQLSSALQRVREIIGSNETSKEFNEILIEQMPLIDVYDSTNYGRFADNEEILKEGGLVLEKYIKVGGQVYSLAEWQRLVDSGQASYGEKKYGMRMSYVFPEGSETPLRDPDPQSERRYKDGYTFNVPGKKIKLNTSLAKRNRTHYSIRSKVVETNGLNVSLNWWAREVNSIPIAEREISEAELNSTITGISVGANLDATLTQTEQIYRNRYENVLKKSLSRTIDCDLMLNHVLMSKKIVTMYMLHSSMILNGIENKFLFEGTKDELKRVFETMKNAGNYNFDNAFSKDFFSGNAGEFQKAFNDIGNPAGPQAASALYYASITPLLILKGLVEISDPNIFVTSKIAAAAANGLLIPKRNEETGDLEYPGESIFLPYSVIANALLPMNIYALVGGSGPPLTPIGLQFLTLEPLLWGLPFFQNMFKNSDVSAEIRNKFNLNLNSSKQIGCDDEEDS